MNEIAIQSEPAAPGDYRQLLREEFTFRKQEASDYSMRRFAVELGLAPSYLNEVLSGKKSLSTDRARSLLPRLRLRGGQDQTFLDLVGFERASDPAIREEFRVRVAHGVGQDRSVELGENFFEPTTRWEDFAILEMTFVMKDGLAPAQLSERLGLSEERVISSLERLERLGLLKVDPKTGFYSKSMKTIELSIPHSKEAGQRFQRDIIRKAYLAQRRLGPARRRTVTTLLPLDSNQLEEAQRILDRASHELVLLSKRSVRPKKSGPLQQVFSHSQSEAQNDIT